MQVYQYFCTTLTLTTPIVHRFLPIIKISKMSEPVRGVNALWQQNYA